MRDCNIHLAVSEVRGNAKKVDEVGQVFAVLFVFDQWRYYAFAQDNTKVFAMLDVLQQVSQRESLSLTGSSFIIVYKY